MASNIVTPLHINNDCDTKIISVHVVDNEIALF